MKSLVMALVFALSWQSLAADLKFCPTYRYSGPINNAKNEIGGYQRVHPSGKFMLTSNGQGFIIDLRDWSRPKLIKTAAEDEVYPVEGSWRLIASPNHQKGKVMNYYPFEGKYGLLSRNEKAKPLFSDSKHNQFYHSAATLSQTENEIRFRTTLWSQTRTRDYRVSFGKEGQIQSVQKGPIFELCPNLFDKSVDNQTRAFGWLHRDTSKKAEALWARNSEIRDRIDRFQKNPRDARKLEAAKAELEISNEEIRQFYSSPGYEAYGRDYDRINMSPYLVNPVLSKDASEIGGFWKGSTRIFKMDKGQCSQVDDLEVQTAKLNFSYPENGKSRYVAFNGDDWSTDISTQRSRGFGRYQALIHDRVTKQTFDLLPEGETAIGYPGFTQDGRVLVAVDKGGVVHIAEITPFNEKCVNTEVQPVQPNQPSAATQ